MPHTPQGPVVRRMFASVAPRYDRANHVLSLGIDHLWRRAAVKLTGAGPGARVLDVCAGTGDLSVALARAGAEVVGSDFCPEMLAGTRNKGAVGSAPSYVADAEVVILMHPHDTEYVYQGAPTTQVGEFTTLTIPIGNIMQEIAAEVFSSCFSFGVVFATVVSLLLVPCSYVVLEDLKAVPRRWRRSSRFLGRTEAAQHDQAA